MYVTNRVVPYRLYNGENHCGWTTIRIFLQYPQDIHTQSYCFIITRHFGTQVSLPSCDKFTHCKFDLKRLLSPSKNKIYLQRMNICFLSSKQTAKTICHRLNNLGMGWNFERFWSEENAPKEVYSFVPLFEKYIDHYGSVAELNVGDMVPSKTVPVPCRAR